MFSVVKTLWSSDYMFKQQIIVHLPTIIWLTAGTLLAVTSGLILVMLMPPKRKAWNQALRITFPPKSAGRSHFSCLSGLVAGLGMMISGSIADHKIIVEVLRVDGFMFTIGMVFLISYLMFSIAIANLISANIHK